MKILIDDNAINVSCQASSYDIMNAIAELSKQASRVLDIEQDEVFSKDAVHTALQKKAMARVLIDNINAAAKHYFDVADLDGVQFETECVLHNEERYE